MPSDPRWEVKPTPKPAVRVVDADYLDWCAALDGVGVAWFLSEEDCRAVVDALNEARKLPSDPMPSAREQDSRILSEEKFRDALHAIDSEHGLGHDEIEAHDEALRSNWHQIAKQNTAMVEDCAKLRAERDRLRERVDDLRAVVEGTIHTIVYGKPDPDAIRYASECLDDDASGKRPRHLPAREALDAGGNDE